MSPEKAVTHILSERTDLMIAVIKLLKQRLHPDREGGDERLFKMLVGDV